MASTSPPYLFILVVILCSCFPFSFLSQTNTSSSSSSKVARKSGLWQGSLLFSSSPSHSANEPTSSNITILTTPLPGLTSSETSASSVPAAVNESLTASHQPGHKEFVYEGIYETLGAGAGEKEEARKERLKQLNSWLSEKDFIVPPGLRLATAASTTNEQMAQPSGIQVTHTEALKSSPFLVNPILQPVFTLNKNNNNNNANGPQKKIGLHENKKSPLTLIEEETRIEEDDIKHHRSPYDDEGHHHKDHHHHHHMDDPLPHDDDGHGVSGQVKAPPCGSHGRFYCTYKEDYPHKIVSEVSKYYKWPLEKLFRDLRQQVMPKLANDNHGGLVCDSVTRVVRPGWARNTNNRWLVVINTDHYQQFVTEVICRNGPSAPCNYVPPCYQATCVQRYNTQKLMVIDPWNPYKGPYMAEFLFPSVCICQINYSIHSSNQYSDATNRRETPAIKSGPIADRLKQPEKAKGEL